MKNTTRIGSSLLGTWTAQVNLSSDDDSSLTAYLMVHFMADPRKGHGCDLSGCSEADNKVCMLSASTKDHGHTSVQKSCRDIAKEKYVSWSDLTVFYYFGVRIHSKSQPESQLEMSTGDWVGPWNLIMAQESSEIPINGTKNETMMDRYVARYVQSQSMTPPFVQNMVPALCTLYTKPDLYAAFLGNPALEHMTRVQTNFSIASTDGDDNKEKDPYAPYRDTCDHGNLQPILPLLELDFFQNTTNSTAMDNDNDDVLQMKLNFQYKIIAVPTPDEQAYRVLPQLQSKFQGVGGYNIIGGPYCYGDDPRRGYSFDLNFSSTASIHATAAKGDNKKMTLVRGCMDGLPCYPPAAMGGIPFQPSNQTCDNHHHPYHPPTPEHNTGIPNMLLAFLSYGLGIALLLSITFHFHVRSQHKLMWKRRRGPAGNNDDEDFMTAMRMSNAGGREEEAAARGVGEEPVYFGAMDLMKGVGIGGGGDNVNHQDETVGPFGDLDGETDTPAVDPLQEPLLAPNESKDEEQDEGKKETQAN